MTDQGPERRVTEAGYFGITVGSDDTIDTDTLYEALLNPHDGGQGKNQTPPPGGMMMPPMGMMGGQGQGGAAPAAGAMPAMTSLGAVPGRVGTAITGAGGGGLAAEGGTLAAAGEPEESAADGEPDLGDGSDAGDASGSGPDLGGADEGGVDLGGADGGPDVGGTDTGGIDAGASEPVGEDVPGLGGEPSFGNDGPPATTPGEEEAATQQAVAHSGETITLEAKIWEGLAAAWPPIRQAVETAGGDAAKGGTAFGLVGEVEHGFNVSHVWLVERAREAGVESSALVDALVETRKKWEQTEQENVARAAEIKVEETA